MRITITFSLGEIEVFKSRLLSWSAEFNEVVWLDGNGHKDKYTSFDALLAVDGLTSLKTDSHRAFEKLEAYRGQTKDWIFGYLSYDLKNDLENLGSSNYDGCGFPEMYFFQPKKIIWIKENIACFNYWHQVADEIDADFEAINCIDWMPKDKILPKNDVRIRLRMFKDEYFRQVRSLLGHIQRGNIYEANFCQEFYAEDTQINPLETYKRLNAISRAPFASYCRFRDGYLLCASPERYVKKKDQRVVSQPIKGTARCSEDPKVDEQLKKALRTDIKERAENIMIVDLVRNDLAKNALKGSVRVEELCEIYRYRQVHQMVSTITAQVAQETSPVAIIRDSFPMGSMTGAPKISAMELIEEHENFKRGLYSGAVGYFSPEGDFDFNVVIRSILYRESKKYVSFSVGSAITARAIPEQEYEECLLKAKAMRQVLENS